MDKLGVNDGDLLGWELGNVDKLGVNDGELLGWELGNMDKLWVNDGELLGWELGNGEIDGADCLSVVMVRLYICELQPAKRQQEKTEAIVNNDIIATKQNLPAEIDGESEGEMERDGLSDGSGVGLLLIVGLNEG